MNVWFYKLFKTREAFPTEYLAATLTEKGLELSSEGDKPVGLVNEICAAEEDINVQLAGIGLWRTGEPVKKGDLLAAGNAGLARKAIDGDFIFARAMEDGVNQVIRVQILNFGMLFFDEADEWNVVKIFFDFPISRHRRWRAISMPNPREDLTKEEIKATGQYAVDNELIMNEAGEIACAVTHAALKRKDSVVVCL